MTGTFSEAMTASTITAGTFTLTAGTTAVPAAVTYNSTGNVATLNPSADLAAGTTYTATIKGGTGGVKDAAGNALTTDRTWTFTTAGSPTGQSPIAVKAASLNGALGAATTAEVYGLKDNGGFQCFERGCIMYSPATGAHVSLGAIRGKWAETGFENGRLGYPVTDEVGGLRDGGVFQNYQGGTIMYSPATGAHISVGAIRGRWAESGYENGRLGYPVSDEVGGLGTAGCSRITRAARSCTRRHQGRTSPLAASAPSGPPQGMKQAASATPPVRNTRPPMEAWLRTIRAASSI